MDTRVHLCYSQRLRSAEIAETLPVCRQLITRNYVSWPHPAADFKIRRVRPDTRHRQPEGALHRLGITVSLSGRDSAFLRRFYSNTKQDATDAV